MNHFSYKTNKSNGFILLTTSLGIFVLLSFFAYYLARLSTSEVATNSNYINDIKTRNLALTGIEHALQSFKQFRNTGTVSGNFNNGSYKSIFDTLYSRNNNALPYTNYISINSSANISNICLLYTSPSPRDS